MTVIPCEFDEASRDKDRAIAGNHKVVHNVVGSGTNIEGIMREPVCPSAQNPDSNKQMSALVIWMWAEFKYSWVEGKRRRNTAKEAELPMRAEEDKKGM